MGFMDFFKKNKVFVSILLIAVTAYLTVPQFANAGGIGAFFKAFFNFIFKVEVAVLTVFVGHAAAVVVAAVFDPIDAVTACLAGSKLICEAAATPFCVKAVYACISP